ncbi:MAG TPA: iron-containing alcohol dehydrogenase [Verrucomicrobiae bacterium]|jgi:alcohol dehydrogenase class IV|nr:iron-containing alcohol dehydrogenase [Verrucomicrobiae bacterium]
MLSNFSFPTKVVFGAGAAREAAGILAAAGAKNPLVVTDAGVRRTEAFAKVMAAGGGKWPVFAEVHPNPMNDDVEAAFAAYRAQDCDAVVALGGGSALDVGKIIRLRVKRPEKKLEEFDFGADWSGLAPLVTIPTTAGTGSEVGRSSVIIFGNVKKCIFHPALLATAAILDPELTVGLPPRLTAATGADALTHGIESFTSPVFHPLCDGIALEAIHLIAQALPRAVKNGADIEARGLMLVAAMMGGIAFQKDLGAAHSLSHPLSSLCGLHHGTANALTLPVVMEFNAARQPGLYRRVGLAFDLTDTSDQAVTRRVREFLEEIGLTGGLAAHGVKPEQLEALADQAFADSCHLTNPVPTTREDLLNLYRKAM